MGKWQDSRKVLGIGAMVAAIFVIYNYYTGIYQCTGELQYLPSGGSDRGQTDPYAFLKVANSTMGEKMLG